MRSFVLVFLFALGCKTEAPPTPTPNNTTQNNPTQTPTSTTTPPQPIQTTPWPERPASVMGEFRIEGFLPTVQAILTQARKVSKEIPPVEAMFGIGLASVLNLSDVGAIDVSRSAGALWVDTPKDPALLIYVGISTEETFRKALPAESITGDAKGNALAFAPQNSTLGEEPVYLNFVNSHVVGSNSPEGFALARPYLEEITKRPLEEPSIWLAIEVSKLFKRYESEIDSGINQILAEIPPTPEADLKFVVSSMMSAIKSVKLFELRHSPSPNAFHISVFLTPTQGSGFEARLSKALPTLIGLEKKLPLGWVSGSFYSDPDELKAWMAAMASVFPLMKESDLFSEEALSGYTGEMAFSSGEGSEGFVGISAVTDEKKVKEQTRAMFAKEKKIKIGGEEVTYGALQKEAETLAGIAIDKVEITASTGPGTTRMAYQPGLVVFQNGTSSGLLESVLKGDASTFESSSDVKEAFAEIPTERYGAIFVSLPMALKALLPLFAPESSLKIPESKSGAAFAWWKDKERLRLELIVPIRHIQEMVSFLDAAPK